MTDGDSLRQESEFYYLTGLEQTGVWLVLVAPEAGVDQTILYVDTLLTHSKPTSKASQATGLFDIRCMVDGFVELPELIESDGSPARIGRLYLSGIIREESDPTVLSVVDTTGIWIGATGAHLRASRVVKDTGELERLQRAVEITANALMAGIEAVEPGVNEGDLEAIIESSMLQAGAARMSFPSIVATGANALQWHYSDNNSVMEDGDLIVVDVGAEYARYASDVTRTLPINGRFTDRQRSLYELVLGARDVSVAAVRPGVTLEEIEEVARAYMRDSSGDLCGTRTCDGYFGHRLSHPLGLDAHDVGIHERLQPGMVITIEPGIYLSAEGIGIRIEDDYVVTSSGAELLSVGLPSTVEEIEAAMAGVP